MRTKEQIHKEIKFYTKRAKRNTEDAEFCTVLAEKYTERIKELEQELKEQGNE